MSQNSNLIGTTTSVIQKHDQGTGRLTSGTIAEILTNSSYHPRGIKVRLADGTVGRISSSDHEEYRPGFASTARLYDNDDDDNGSSRPRQRPTLADYIITPPPPPSRHTTTTTTHEQEQRAQHELREQQLYEQEQDGVVVGGGDQTTANDWDCSLCTFVNSGLLPNCEMCDTLRVK